MARGKGRQGDMGEERWPAQDGGLGLRVDGSKFRPSGKPMSETQTGEQQSGNNVYGSWDQRQGGAIRGRQV